MYFSFFHILSPNICKYPKTGIMVIKRLKMSFIIVLTIPLITSLYPINAVFCLDNFDVGVQYEHIVVFIRFNKDIKSKLCLLVRKDMDINEQERLSNITLRHKLK